ncbi:MAG: coproporphyrinogen-III oxidase family protein [Spirochaetales bacterium]
MNLAARLSESLGAFETPRSLYIHIPFCSSRCAYCDFHSFSASTIADAAMSSYIDVLLARAESLCGSMVAFPETIYIGGGTPTVLGDALFRRLLEGLRALFSFGLREWTLEANPESLTPTKIDMMVSNKVTRLSIGIQSMDEEALGILGRGAKVADNRRAVALAAGSGLELSADLIAALPVPKPGAGRRKYSLPDSAEYLAGEGFGHLSIYDLVVEEGTRIKRRLEAGELVSADEDSAFEERKEAENILEDLGYKRYEVSNYCLPGRESLHNGCYWAMNSYLGIGSGAVSTLIVADPEKANRLGAGGGAAMRFEEGRDLASYIENPDGSGALSWISRGDSAFEMVMMALRTSRGLDERRFRSRFGLEASRLLSRTIKTWSGHFSEGEGRLSLDGSGLDILNRILVDALGEMEPYFQEKAGNL